MKIGYAVNANAVTVGSSLDHCHIPGREHHRSIPDDVVVLGMGIHNEPGLHEISPMPKVEDLVKDMLKYCLDPSDEDRAFVEFKPDDVVLLLINNFGGRFHEGFDGGFSQISLRSMFRFEGMLLGRDSAAFTEKRCLSAFVS